MSEELQDRKLEIARLRKQGLSIRAIQKELNISSPSLVHFHLKRVACKYPVCPICRKQSVVGFNPPGNKKKGLYCCKANCEYEVKFEDLIYPIK